MFCLHPAPSKEYRCAVELLRALLTSIFEQWHCEKPVWYDSVVKSPKHLSSKFNYIQASLKYTANNRQNHLEDCRLVNEGDWDFL